VGKLEARDACPEEKEVALAILEMQFSAFATDLDDDNVALDFKTTNADASAGGVYQRLFALSESPAVDHGKSVVLSASNSVEH
jgi:hypothetical protein